MSRLSVVFISVTQALETQKKEDKKSCASLSYAVSSGPAWSTWFLCQNAKFIN